MSFIGAHFDFAKNRLLDIVLQRKEKKYNFFAESSFEVIYKALEDIAFATLPSERNFEQHMICAWRKFIEKNYRQAEEYVNCALKLNDDLLVESNGRVSLELKKRLPMPPGLLAHINLCQEEQGKKQEKDTLNSIANASFASTRDEDYLPVYVISAQANLNENQFDRASQLLEKCLKKNPIYFPACLLQANVWLQQKKYKEISKMLNNFTSKKSEYEVGDEHVVFFSIMKVIINAKQGTKLADIFGLYENVDKKLWQEICLELEPKIQSYVQAIRILFDNMQAINEMIVTMQLKQNQHAVQKIAGQVEVLNKLNSSLQTYLPQLFKDDNNENAKKALYQALANTKKELGSYGRMEEILKNIGLALVLLGVGYVVAGCINLYRTHGKHFAFFTKESELKVEAIQEIINDKQNVFAFP